jgi:hypothetical protein
MTNDQWLEWCDECRASVFSRDRFAAMIAPANMEAFDTPFQWLDEDDPIPPPSVAGRKFADWLACFSHRPDESAARVAEEPFTM